MVSRSLTRSSQSVFVEDSICDRLTFALRVVETGLLITATEKNPITAGRHDSPFSAVRFTEQKSPETARSTLILRETKVGFLCSPDGWRTPWLGDSSSICLFGGDCRGRV